jgi:hypothetical protein
LSSSQKTEILRRQAFGCAKCQKDLEPIGNAPAHFEQITALAAKGPPAAEDFQALCPECHALRSGSESARTSEEEKRRLRESGRPRSTKKFVKSGIDTRKF